MESEEIDNKREGIFLADIFKSMLTAFKKNLAGMVAVFVVYGGIAAAIQLIFGKDMHQTIITMRVLLSVIVTISLISLLRSVFESGKLKFKSVFPRFGFIGKLALSAIFIILFSLLAVFLLGILSVFVGYFFMMIFGRLFTANTIYFFAGACVFLNLLFYAFFSFCLIAFSGKNSFGESLGISAKIFLENKLLTFFVLALLAAGITALAASYVNPILSYFGKPTAASIKKVAALQEFLITDFAVISAALMPVYWFFMMAVYFVLGHEGDTKKIIEAKTYYGQYYSQYAGMEENLDDEPKAQEDEGYDSFSLSNAFYFSWGIYKKICAKLTGGIAAVYAVYALLCVAGVYLLQKFSFIAPVLSGSTPSVKDAFFLCAGGLVLYYFLMFFYGAFVRGFFRGKGIEFKNFFPPFKVTLRYAAFLCFIAVFILSIPFIIEKVDLLMQITIKSYTFPFTAVVAGCSVLFAVIIVFALVSFFYVPMFLLDGHHFSESLTICSEMMKGQKMVFFCVLAGLALINLISHALIIAWLFVVPFTVLVLIQIYTTISLGYSKYKEDIVNYE